MWLGGGGADMALWQAVVVGMVGVEEMVCGGATNGGKRSQEVFNALPLLTFD